MSHPENSLSIELDSAQRTDKELAVAFKAGQCSDAYRAIHERHHARVEAICRRMLRDDRDAEEAAQETFLRVYQGLSRFNGRYQLGAWVARIATNVCLDSLRSRGRKPVDPTSDVDVFERCTDRPPRDPETVYLQHLSDRRVLEILKGLPPVHCAAIFMRDVEGLSYSEIAVHLEMSESQVKALLHRARKKFRSNWAGRAASALLPTSLLGRFRRFGDHTKEAAATPSAASASSHLASGVPAITNFASSCSGLLSTCGQVLGERAATVVAAAVVGGAAVGGVAAIDPAPLSHRVVASPSPSPETMQEAEVKSARTTDDGTQNEEASAAPQASPTPVATPAVAASPAPSPEPSQSSPSPSPSPSPEPPKEPQGFRFVADAQIGPDDPCTCASPTKVDEETLNVDESGVQYFKQWITGSATYRNVAVFGLRLKQASSSGSDHSLAFSLHTAEGSYMYETSGSLQYKGRTDWGGHVYRYAGTYHLTSRPTASEPVPTQGAYMSEIVFSWRQQRIVATTFSLR